MNAKPRTKSKRWILVVVQLGLGAIVGAAGLLLLLMAGAPGSRDYRPYSPKEEKSYARAKRDVFPDDVERDPSAYKDVLVAWPGVITSFEVEEKPDTLVIHFKVEHRYFDWIEDKSIQKEVYFLSPRGEGTFSCDWPMPREARDQVTAHIHDGDMLIVYGHPLHGVDGLVLKAEYVRLVEAKWYSDEVLDYGRPGTPSKILKTPL